MAKLPWTPWHQVVRLRDELKSGELAMHMFAADLYEVLMQGGKHPLYEKPENFFALTFPTHNLRALVRDVALRLAGKNDKAVRQLELTYGGGKTHTLITLRHIVNDPDNLPKLSAVDEFIQAIGQRPTRARVAGLCFDKLDVESGMDVRSPDGKVRRLKQPWSVLAYQIAGEKGLEALHPDHKAQERDSAPAENLLTELFEIPVKQGLGVLILLDEVLMYAREKAALAPEWRGRLVNFFQYMTQAATKVDRCCVVASLLATDPKKSDELGRQILDEMYDVFRRQREEGVEPVVREDVAEVLRRRFFKPETIRDPNVFRPHVIAALQGIKALDDQTAKQAQTEEKRLLDSYPFHPKLTEVLYENWTQIPGFQRTRGLLRTFALALREAEKWDTCPLVGASVFLSAPGSQSLSESLREFVVVADTQSLEGRKQAWTSILDGELKRARDAQSELVGLSHREVEQAVVATFLHSQPTGRSAKTRDLTLLLGPTRPDKIDLEKGLVRWAQTSHWLDDALVPTGTGQIPTVWRLGNKPNLTQMHAQAASEIQDDIVRARLIDEIGKVKLLTTGAQSSGVKTHVLPARPKDVDDDGVFRYAVLSLNAASDSGKPSAEAVRFLDETTGPEKPRVYRNALILLTPSKDGLDVALARVRDYLAWERVKTNLDEEKARGNAADPARLSTLGINLDKARGQVPLAIRQAYCIVVTVSEANAPQAFKITVLDEPSFDTIKLDKRSRIQESPVTAEALLPGGPFDLWRDGETCRRVKDLAGAFAQLPHLPKMLKAQAILDTLKDGCQQGAFVLRLMRPDRTFRTWWRSRPDGAAMEDPALELVLLETVELIDLTPELLRHGDLPGLWEGDETPVAALVAYFDGKHTIQITRNGYTETMHVPRASRPAVEAAVTAAVEQGMLWLTNGPSSLLGEPIPLGVLTDEAKLRMPPVRLLATEVLPANLPAAWKDSHTTAAALAAALSQKRGQTLPWLTIRDVLSEAINARYLEIEEGSPEWPAPFASAGSVRLKHVTAQPRPGPPGGSGGRPDIAVASSPLKSDEFQDLADALPPILELGAKKGVAITLRAEIELGDGSKPIDAATRYEFDALLSRINPKLKLR